jgi:hypothetical protein
MGLPPGMHWPPTWPLPGYQVLRQEDLRPAGPHSNGQFQGTYATRLGVPPAARRLPAHALSLARTVLRTGWQHRLPPIIEEHELGGAGT